HSRGGWPRQRCQSAARTRGAGGGSLRYPQRCPPMQTTSDTRHQPQVRQVIDAVTGDDDLGPFKLLPGTWSNEPGLAGRGWNMIALPFGRPPSATFKPPYRLLMNQYNENLIFDLVDKAVP